MAKTPARRDHQPGRPAPAPEDHHWGQRARRGRLSVEGAHARNKDVRIAAAIGMVSPDKLAAAALVFLHPALTSLPVTVPAYQHIYHRGQAESTGR